LTQEQHLLLACEITEFDRSIRKQKFAVNIPNGANSKSCTKMIRQAFLPDPMPEWLIKQMKERLYQQRSLN